MPDFKAMLTGWGFANAHFRGSEIIADCIFCGGKRKFYFNEDNQNAICFKGCFAGSAAALVSLIEGVGREEAKARLSVGINWFTKFKSTVSKEERRATRRTEFQLPELRPFNNQEIEYIKSRNLSVGVVKESGAKGCDDFVGVVAAFTDCERLEAETLINAFPGKFDYLKGRIFWPIYNDDTLLSVEARSIIGSQPKVCYPLGINLKQTVYRSVNSKQTDWIVIVEGLLDELTIEAWGYPGGATFSASVSKFQSAILHRYSRVYCAYDPDKGGEEGLISALSRLYNGTLVYEVKLPEGKDPNDCSQFEFDSRFANSKVITDSHPAMIKLKKRRQQKASERRRN